MKLKIILFILINVMKSDEGHKLIELYKEYFGNVNPFIKKFLDL